VPRDAVAVAVHDVEPATFERAALIRDWLDDHSIDRVALLVVPAPDLHPFDSSSTELATWLLERTRRGDAVAQHGLTSRGRRAGPRRTRPPRSGRRSRARAGPGARAS
jgi:predicted deacetylase